ncbi:MAG: hypothetical protein U0W24_04340 [Bacteroidales bacterium]
MSQYKMIYDDYKKAALKQLKTCRRLESTFRNITSSYERDAVLRSIYYLSGYIIEGIVNYSLYKVCTFPQNENVKKLNHSFGTGKKIAFFWRDLNGYIGQKYVIQNHDFMKNVDVLKVKLPSKFSTIPVLSDGNQNLCLNNLLNNWNVHIRYHAKNTIFQPFSFETYSEIEIFDFLNLAEEIYIRLPQIV